MSTEVRVAGNLIPGRVSISQDAPGFVTAAERGGFGSGAIQIEDPVGNLTIKGWQTITVDETLATPTRVFTGYIHERAIGRGGKFKTGAGRVHDCTIVDENPLLNRVLNRFIDNDAKRPDETDVARVAWLLGSRAMTGIVFDEGLVATDNPGTYLAADLRRKYAYDVLSELAASTVKNHFVYHDESSGNPALFRDRDDATVWAATIGISNDLADVDSDTVFYPSIDASLGRSPENQFTGVDYGWKGDPIWTESASILADLGGFRNEAVYDTDRIGRLTTAQGQSIAWLNVRAKEEDTITVTLLLPATHVNLAYAGQEMDVKFTHIPGYEAWTTTRIRRRNARPVTRSRWQVTYELWVKGPAATDATSPTFSHDCSTLDALGNTITNTPAGTYAPLLATAPTSRADGLILYLRPGLSYPTAPYPSFGGAWSFDDYNVGGVDYFGTCTGSFARSFVLGPGTITVRSAQYTVAHTATWSLWYNSGGIDYLVDSGSGAAGTAFTITVPNDGNCIHWVDLGDLGSPECGDKVGYGGFDWEPLVAAPLPATGALISEEATGSTDGTNVSFSGSGGWIPGSLRVLHDGFDQTNHVINEDAEAGTYDLDYAPSAGSVIRHYFEAR